MTDEKKKFPWGDLTRLVKNTIDPKLKAQDVRVNAGMDAMREKHEADMDALNSALDDIIKDFGEYMSLAEQMSDLIEMHHRDHLAHEERLDALDLKTADIEREYKNKIIELEKNFNSEISKIENNITNINTSIKIDPDGGIINDSGGLKVDFSKMPTDKMEALLKTLRVPIWLTKHTNFYVDKSTGSDTLDEGRGLTPEKAFKTINACLRYVSANYNLNIYNVTILVAPGDYKSEGNINCLKYTTTSGVIIIQGTQNTPSDVIVRSVRVTSGMRYYVRWITSTGYHTEIDYAPAFYANCGGSFLVCQGVVADLSKSGATNGRTTAFYAAYDGRIEILVSSDERYNYDTKIIVNPGYKLIKGLFIAHTNGCFRITSDIEIVGTENVNYLFYLEYKSVCYIFKASYSIYDRWPNITQTEGTATCKVGKCLFYSVLNFEVGNFSSFPVQFEKTIELYNYSGCNGNISGTEC